MKQYLFILLLIPLVATIIFQEWRFQRFQDDLAIVSTRQQLRDRKYKLEETDFLRTAKNSIVMLKCSDTTSPAKSWIATATKIHSHHLVSAYHAISSESNSIKRTYPFKCSFSQEGQKMGEFKINSELEARQAQVGTRDMAIIKVNFNEAGSKLPVLIPKDTLQPSVGDVVALISSPAKFHLDATVSFGVILANKVKHSLAPGRQIFWQDAISSDVIASAASSGGALIYFGKEPVFAGVHVGNNSGSGLYLAYYQLLFDHEFFKRYYSLKDS